MADERKDELQQQRQLRGLYRHINISVKALNWIIIVLCAALILCFVIAISHQGYLVSFDTLGGTAVAGQMRMYGELIEAPEPPTREGYAFDGWYRDPNAAIPWDLNQDIVTESITLYAGWQEIP